MSRLISFSICYTPELHPITMLGRVLKSDFPNHLCPKIGMVKLGQDVLEFGPQLSSYFGELINGEQLVSKEMTALTGYSDATQDILAFLHRHSETSGGWVEIFGDTLMEYIADGNLRQDRVYRCGSDNYYGPILRCHMSQFKSTLMQLSIYCPLLFSKHYVEDDAFSSLRQEIAERNWRRVVNVVNSTISVTGQEHLQEVGLHIEGFYYDTDWLVAAASILPKLAVDFA